MIKRNTRCWQCNQSYNMRCLVCPNCEAANANQDLTQANAESIGQETVYEKSGNLPVAEIIECNVMGQQTIMEIEGRLKFARIGDKLYTQPSQAAQTVEPVAWQWLDTGTFRKTLPKTADPLAWRPLFIHPAPVRQPLTHTEIVRAWDASITEWIDAKQNPYTHFARAIEAAHGITTPKEAT